MAHSILRPGFMVSLKTTLKGGVNYQRRELDATDAVEDALPGAAVARWETTKIVEDPEEHDRATRARSDARNLITRHCVATSFGLLCPEAKERELADAITEARALVSAHNQTATCTQVSVFVLSGKIAETDAESARAIGEEIRSLIGDMSTAIDCLSPEQIRDAAGKAAKIAIMLQPDQAEKVGAAVIAARKAARDITRRLIRDAEPAAVVLADLQRGAIENARIAFLDFDLDGSSPLDEDALPAVELARIVALDLRSDVEDPAYLRAVS